MEVDQAAPLVLGDLGVRQPSDLAETFTRQPDAARQLAAELHDEPVPQLPGMSLPEHRARVVVAARTQRLAESRIVLPMPDVAPSGNTVRAAVRRLTGSAGPHPTILLTARVDRTEAGSGEGGEHPGCSPTSAGISLPPTSPARTRWYVSAR
ncbi:hypothetical protein SVIO_072860 [Streptomyces violaceusniger]|uniref:Uncharacterized protein n=1 Tax=Streptomyces violaceusniger TaxID=68280 RepID=A0A4D4LEX7_STRVO|nr:hypothetical protein SVIO_072860 [Streptomyces violaceusniger]